MYILDISLQNLKISKYILEIVDSNPRYKYLELVHEETEHSDSKNKYSEDDIIKMLELLFDNIFVVFAEKVFQQTVGIPMGTNCAPLLADILFLFIRSGIHTVFAFNGKETVSITFHSQLQVHQSCIVNGQPRIRKLSGPDVSC